VRDMLKAVSCLSKIQLVCTTPRPIDELITVLRTDTKPGQGVLFFNQDNAYTSQTLSVRYSALRPLVYTARDSGLLSYADRSALPAWLKITGQWEALRADTNPQEKLAGLVSLAAVLKADYLVIDFKVAPQVIESLPVSVLMQNAGYIVLILH
jgi:hypothetical protein